MEKSRFITTVARVDSVDEAVAVLKAVRKKYYDATHNCYAYIVDDKMKYSDDGEPQGTAGLPIFDYLRGHRMNRICVVVTRYFGGVKLGTGGLVRAYGGAVSDAIYPLPHWAYVDCIKTEVVVDYTSYNAVRNELKYFCKTLDTRFDDKVTMITLSTDDMYNTIADIVSEITNGKGTCKVLEYLMESFVPDTDKESR